jgi:alkylhydroperoxidase/carboxymuconolactone decarboxylase family protein YurZ
LKRLLGIAAQIQRGGKYVSSEDIAAARSEGATDMEIHDTVLIAAAFCMYNRYVDGLATIQPEADEAYIDMGRHLAKHGYIQSSQTSIAAITNSEIE